jgi:hypothetical protein
LCCSSCEVPLILVRVWWNLNFLDRFSQKTQISNFMKICPVGAELFHVEGQMDEQTDRHEEINNHFSQFCQRAWQPTTTENQNHKFVLFLIVVPPCILISINYLHQRMHYLLKCKILQFVFKYFFLHSPYMFRSNGSYWTETRRGYVKRNT